jgi:hypothetical protein
MLSSRATVRARFRMELLSSAGAVAERFGPEFLNAIVRCGARRASRDGLPTVGKASRLTLWFPEPPRFPELTDH